jgi:energy-coupling factor transporter ATP-binding protein EcfA2
MRIAFEGVHYSYKLDAARSAQSEVFSGLNLELEPRKLYILTGQNGTGKSTLARMMAGIIHPSRGRVLINNRDVRNLSLTDAGKLVGYVMQSPSRQLIMNTAAEEVAFGLMQRGLSKGAAKALGIATLKEFGLSEAYDSFPQRMSKGEQARLAMASVFVLRPGWLVLDETLASLDPISKAMVLNKAQEAVGTGCGVIIIAHDSELASETGGIRVQLQTGGNALVG